MIKADEALEQSRDRRNALETAERIYGSNFKKNFSQNYKKDLRKIDVEIRNAIERGSFRTSYRFTKVSLRDIPYLRIAITDYLSELGYFVETDLWNSGKDVNVKISWREDERASMEEGVKSGKLRRYSECY